MGEIGGAPFYISGSQYEAWKHTDIVIDVVPGRGGMFSLDNGREKRFLVRSEMCEIPAPAKASGPLEQLDSRGIEDRWVETSASFALGRRAS